MTPIFSGDQTYLSKFPQQLIHSPSLLIVMVGFINQILTLLNELDDDDLQQFDVDIDTNMRSLSGDRRPMGPAHRRGDESSRQPREKYGREKFRAKRKVRKINRLLKEARRKGYNVDEMLGTNLSKPPLIRTDIAGETIDITVDRGDAMLEIEDGVVTVSFENIDHTETVPINIDSPVVETIQNMGVTTFSVHPDGSEDSSDHTE